MNWSSFDEGPSNPYNEETPAASVFKREQILVPKPPFGDHTAAQELNSFQYAGPLRIPPDGFQLRARKEVATKDSVNARFVETWAASVPQQQTEYYRTDLPDGGIMTQMSASPRTREESQVLAAFPRGNVGIAEIRETLRKTENNAALAIQRLTAKIQADGREDTSPRDSRVPVALKAVYQDMAPLSSRTDPRDFRQSKPYDPLGPNLAENPFFDRYDPTRDPRNMVREVRSVVYENKEPDRGQKESERIRNRTFTNRYTPDDEKESSKLTEWYELMRPKIDNPQIVYRGQSETWKLGAALK